VKEIVTYLNFDGTCRQAMEFYKKCLGADLHLIPFSEVPGALPPEAKGAEDRIMHAMLRKGSACIMASDLVPGMHFQPGTNFAISLHCDSIPEAEALFAAFSEKAKIVMPLQETFWATRYGMLTDQFGIGWMFNLEKPREG
jgi:PhnB protein